MTALTVTSRVPEILALLNTLEPGERRVLEDINWEEYKQLLAELGDGYAVRISFAEGSLELMAPLYRHEHDKEIITAMVQVLVEECGLDMEAAGSTTLKLARVQEGAEPDTCFYIQQAAAVRGHRTINLDSDPPPDLVVEVDITRPRRSKIKTYARLRVPEFWRFDGQRLEIFALVAGKFVARTTSPTFPFLSTNDLVTFIERSYEDGRMPALRKFRRWVKAHKS